MPKHYRLTTRAQMHGEIREPGYVFTLAEGEIGPHRTVSAGAPEAQIADHIGGAGELRDVPLYTELSDDEERAIEEAEAAKIAEADAHAETHPDRRAVQGEEASGELRQDGPTIAEYVAAGYAPEDYPPSGYASRSTAEEIQAAIDAKSSPKEEDEPIELPAPADDGKPLDPEAGGEKPPAA